jgi:prepilin signal peptidase PulO-like enzyme (type II secretory pathway)
MTLIIAVALGAILGFILSFYAHHLPLKIRDEEDYWITKLSGKESSPSAPQSFRQALSSYAWFGRNTFFFVFSCSVFAFLLAFIHSQEFPANDSRMSGVDLQLVGLIFFGCVLITLAVIDWRSQLLPDDLTLSLLWLGLIVQLFESSRTVGLEQSVIGAVIGYSVLWVTGNLFSLLRGLEGLGYGDMKLLAAVGAWLGPLEIIYVLLFGSLLALLWHAVPLLRKKLTSTTEFAFGPWLILAVLIRLVF